MFSYLIHAVFSPSHFEFKHTNTGEKRGFNFVLFLRQFLPERPRNLQIQRKNCGESSLKQPWKEKNYLVPLLHLLNLLPLPFSKTSQISKPPNANPTFPVFSLHAISPLLLLRELLLLLPHFAAHGLLWLLPLPLLGPRPPANSRRSSLSNRSPLARFR